MESRQQKSVDRQPVDLRADKLAAQVRELEAENAELHRLLAELRQSLRRLGHDA